MFNIRTEKYWHLKTETRVKGWPRIKGNGENRQESPGCLNGSTGAGGYTPLDTRTEAGESEMAQPHKHKSHH